MNRRIFLCVLFMSVIILVSVFIYEKNLTSSNILQANIINYNNVKDNYNSEVVTNKNANIFLIDDNVHILKGKISKDTNLSLDGIKNNFYKIKDMPFYISYDNVTKNTQTKDKRYKKYLKLGIKITTNDTYTMYQSDNKYIKVNYPYTYDIIYKDNDKYYFEFNDNLYYIYDEDIKEKEEYSTGVKNVEKIPVLNYHFFYDEDKEFCGEILCLEKKKFEEHLKYFKDNDYLTLTMEEYYNWLNGNINLSEKSVLITVDDGALGTDTILIELLEKYNLNASLFLITEWWKDKDFTSNNLEVFSHGNDIHVDNYCSKGSKGLCLSYNELKADIEKSLERSKSNLAFCYPFYKYNDNMIKVLNDLDFKLSFIGGNRKSTKSDNRLLLPRYIVYRYQGANDIAKMLN